VIVDARPEEVTDWERAVAVPVYSSPPDRSPEAHVRLAELALERSKRIVEQGDDVVVLLDSITRLARAGSLLRPRTRRDALEGETVEGEGLEVAAARFVKRWFSTARTAEQGGSLTIVATVHVESGLTLEETVYGALADSANLELRLDHELSLAGRYPALDVNRCWSRDEAAVMGDDELHRLRTLRDWLRPLSPADAWDAVVEKVRGA
jgi:transcription termination factor Rho